MAHLEDQKKKKTQQAGWKRKLVNDIVEPLQKHKLFILNDTEAMIKLLMTVLKRQENCIISPTQPSRTACSGLPRTKMLN